MPASTMLGSSVFKDGIAPTFLVKPHFLCVGFLVSLCFLTQVVRDSLEAGLLFQEFVGSHFHGKVSDKSSLRKKGLAWAYSLRAQGRPGAWGIWSIPQSGNRLMLVLSRLSLCPAVWPLPHCRAGALVCAPSSVYGCWQWGLGVPCLPGKCSAS